MEYENQPELNNGLSEINDTENDHSNLLSKMIYRQCGCEVNLKFTKNLFELDQDQENDSHPNAPLHKLSDIIKKKLENNNNEDEIEEEEEDLNDEEKQPPNNHAHLLSEKLIELCPQIFQKSLV